jgi:AcrR family transcriptional regulator
MATDKTKAKITTALMALIAERRFSMIGLDDVAARAEISLADLRAAYASVPAILADHAARVDRAVLEGDDPAMADEPIKERLFDVLMRRFDVLSPDKAGIKALFAQGRRDPALGLLVLTLGVSSMRWMLAAAKVDHAGLLGLARAKALAFAYARVIDIWVDEDDAGLPRTMAALDKALDQLGRIAAQVDRFRAFDPRRFDPKERFRDRAAAPSGAPESGPDASASVH